MSRWPKQLPPIDPELARINDDFMRYWHELYPSRFGIADRWGHRYALAHAPAGFRRTLEVGAGLGEHLAFETLSPAQEREYVALELRENMAERIRSRFPRVQVRVGDVQRRLEFPDRHFDRIVAIHVLEHLPDLPAALSELRRVCAPEGALEIVIPCEGSLATWCARRISAQRIYERRYGRSYRHFIEREHLNRPFEVIEELERHFVQTHRTAFPIPLPFEWCNLFLGMTWRPKP